MSKRKRALLAAIASLLVAATLFVVPTVWLKPWSIHHFYTRVFLGFALRHPMLLSQLRVLEPLGLDFHNDDLDDASVAFQEREAAWVARQLEILRSYDRASMDAEAALSYDVLEWYLADAVEGNRFLFHDYPLNQLSGEQSNLPDFMLNTHRIDDLEGARDYVARLSAFGRYFDQVLEGVRVREERGILPPRFVLDEVIAEMEAFIAPEPRQHVLFTHCAAALEALDDVTAGDRETVLARLAEVLESSVYPAYRRLLAAMVRQRRIATNDDGVWKLPQGDAYYAHLLRHYTTTDLTAEEIHRLGLAEVERLQAEMASILAAQGYPSEDVGGAMSALNREERFLYPDTAAGRAQILRDYQAILDEIDADLEGVFETRPRAGLVVKRIPEFKQETSPGAYYQSAPLDGSRPGTFFVNLRSVQEIPRFGMRTLAYHEGIPGHHFQIGIAQELEDVPFFRKVIPFTAYTEGWALYAERVAAEQGFEDEPFDRLGYLTGQLFRAVRLVVDTGIHARRWTRAEAIDYMLASTGMPESDVVAEVERYIVSPGQACAYEVGQLEILKLRRRAMRRLGDAFDLAAFHEEVLTHGALPLALLGEVIDRWIDSAAGRGPPPRRAGAAALAPASQVQASPRSS